MAGLKSGTWSRLRPADRRELERARRLLAERERGVHQLEALRRRHALQPGELDDLERRQRALVAEARHELAALEDHLDRRYGQYRPGGDWLLLDDAGRRR